MNSTNPWDISLEARKREFIKAKKQGRKLAIILYSSEDLASSFRYRAYNIYQATKNSKKWQLIYFFTSEIESIMQLIPESNLVILGRIHKWSIKYDEFVFLARSNHLKVLLDLDDCVCGQSHIKEMFNVVSPDSVDQDYWLSASANIELLANLTDGFITTNDFLGKLLSRTHHQKPYKVIPNFLNQQQIIYSSNLPPKDINSESTFTIGYFSGSHTHLTDFESVYAELLQLLKDYEDIKIRIVGMLSLPQSASYYLKSGRIEIKPIVDYLTLQKLISEVNLNIAPLADNIFANCKSELKFFEAAIVRTPTLASPTAAFKSAIQNSKTGFLCRPGEWYDTILKLRNDQELSKTVSNNAYNYCLEKYSPDYNIATIERVYDYYSK